MAAPKEALAAYQFATGTPGIEAGTSGSSARQPSQVAPFRDISFIAMNTAAQNGRDPLRGFTFQGLSPDGHRSGILLDVVRADPTAHIDVAGIPFYQQRVGNGAGVLLVPGASAEGVNLIGHSNVPSGEVLEQLNISTETLEKKHRLSAEQAIAKLYNYLDKP